jgi:hypothetical protein
MKVVTCPSTEALTLVALARAEINTKLKHIENCENLNSSQVASKEQAGIVTM